MQRLVTGYALIEGPLWIEGTGLLFSDVLDGGVYVLGPDGKVSTAVPSRKGIGGMVEHADGGLVVGGRDISRVVPGKEGSTTLLTRDAIPGSVGFNDFTTDAAGRIYVGSLGYRVFSDDKARPGHLHVIDLDGSVRTVSDGIWLTNGMGFSPDGTRLYHSDARANVIRVYPVHDGEVGAWETFARIEGGHPDGLCVAADGSVLVAVAHGGRVDVFAPDGTLRHSIEVPLPMVTSVAFGGAGLEDLYVVTGSVGGPDDHCGSVFRTSVDIAGLAVPPCRVSLATT